MILVFQHEAHEGPGALGAALRNAGHPLHFIRVYAGAPLPANLDGVEGILSLGGSPNVTDKDKHPWMEREMALLKEAHGRGIPIVGICLGAQLIAAALGGEVGPADKAEIGMMPVNLSFFGGNDPLLVGMPSQFNTLHAHGQEVKKAPPGGTPAPLASSKDCKCQAFRVGLRTYGFQYHFEWTLQDFVDFLQGSRAWLAALNLDPEILLNVARTNYPRYRELGDRQCRLIVERLFHPHLRVPNFGENVENFHAHK